MVCVGCVSPLGSRLKGPWYGEVSRDWCWLINVYCAPTGVGQLDSGHGWSESTAGLQASACAAPTDVIHAANQREVESRLRITLRCRRRGDFLACPQRADQLLNVLEAPAL